MAIDKASQRSRIGRVGQTLTGGRRSCWFGGWAHEATGYPASAILVHDGLKLLIQYIRAAGDGDLGAMDTGAMDTP